MDLCCTSRLHGPGCRAAYSLKALIVSSESSALGICRVLWDFGILELNACFVCRYVLGINPFSDMSYTEFNAIVLMPPIRNSTAAATTAATVAPRKRSLHTTPSPSSTALASCSVDWRNPKSNPLKLNATTGVKNQANCGEPC